MMSYCQCRKNKFNIKEGGNEIAERLLPIVEGCIRVITDEWVINYYRKRQEKI